MPIRKITIRDIAEVLGISVSTVSRALKDHPDINAETKANVRRVATELNYRPNALALSLRQRKSHIIGLVVPELSHNYFAAIVAGMDDTASQRGYITMLTQSYESPEREQKALDKLVDTCVDGILISPTKLTTDPTQLVELLDEGLPLVLFDRALPGLETTRVTTDDVAGTKAATLLMAGKGARRIALLCGAASLSVSRHRREGYEAALTEAGLQADETLVMEADTPERLAQQRDDFLAMMRRADALLCINDLTAAAALRMLADDGRDVPSDVQIVGFGNDPFAAMISPSLTTVEQNGYEVGKVAMSALLDQVESGLVVARKTEKKIATSVIERGTTRP